MADYRSEDSIGARIKAARRQRGYRTTRELADAIPGGRVTAAILENIESGRKADPSVSQLLTIAHTLGIPPSFLLAPIGRPDDPVDLPNLSDDVAAMTVAEFEAWLSSTPASAYQPRLVTERTDIDLLNSLREFHTLLREVRRLHIVRDVQASSADPDLLAANAPVQERLNTTALQATRMAAMLTNAGFTLTNLGTGIDIGMEATGQRINAS